MPQEATRFLADLRKAVNSEPRVPREFPGGGDYDELLRALTSQLGENAQDRFHDAIVAFLAAAKVKNEFDDQAAWLATVIGNVTCAKRRDESKAARRVRSIEVCAKVPAPADIHEAVSTLESDRELARTELAAKLALTHLQPQQVDIVNASMRDGKTDSAIKLELVATQGITRRSASSKVKSALKLFREHFRRYQDIPNLAKIAEAGMSPPAPRVVSTPSRSEEARKRRSEEAKKRRSEEAKKRRSEEAKKRRSERLTDAEFKRSRWIMRTLGEMLQHRLHASGSRTPNSRLDAAPLLHTAFAAAFYGRFCTRMNEPSVHINPEIRKKFSNLGNWDTVYWAVECVDLRSTCS